jgi:hypothetical protein
MRSGTTPAWSPRSAGGLIEAPVELIGHVEVIEGVACA